MGSTVFLILLSACFVTQKELDAALDRDGDGFLPVVAGGDDCDEGRSDVNPGVMEVCGDGIDNDCDGSTDDRGVGEREWYLDEDGDNVGVEQTTMACSRPEGFAPISGDCDDTNTAFHPGVNDEDCDGLDQDCDGIPDDEIALTVRFRDADGDGFGTVNETTESCLEIDGFVSVAGDCDDNNATISPAAEDFCDGLDQDCDGVVDDDAEYGPIFVDDDGDGFGVLATSLWSCSLPQGFAVEAGDCDDTDGSVNPLASDLCDGVDRDCDGVADDDAPLVSYFQDLDGDGAGNATVGVDSCTSVPGFSPVSGDCDDGDASVSPLLEDACDGLDNNCNGSIDEDVVRTMFFEDSDGDGVGSSVSLEACAAPPGYSALTGDCDDSDVGVQPGIADAVCDGIDRNCDGDVNEGASFVAWFRDADGDGLGSSGTFELTCDGPPAGFVATAGDCDDGDASVQIRSWFPDGDGDGFGSGVPVLGCEAPAGHSAFDTDCDDVDAFAFPTNDETCGNGVDDDCDVATNCRFHGTIDIEVEADLVVPLPDGVVGLVRVPDVVGGAEDDWVLSLSTRRGVAVVAGGPIPDLLSPQGGPSQCEQFEVLDLTGDGKGDFLCSDGSDFTVYGGDVTGLGFAPEMTIQGTQSQRGVTSGALGAGVWARQGGQIVFKVFEPGRFGGLGGLADPEIVVEQDDDFFLMSCTGSNHPCLVVSSRAPTVYRDLGAGVHGEFSAYMSFPSQALSNVNLVQQWDLNGDGIRDFYVDSRDPDFVYRLRWHEGPLGPNRPEIDTDELFAGNFVHDFRPAGDLDGDGLPDWHILSPVDGSNRVFYGRTGNLPAASDVVLLDHPVTIGGVAHYGAVTRGDWNADGLDDLVLVDEMAGSIFVMLGEGI